MEISSRFQPLPVSVELEHAEAVEAPKPKQQTDSAGAASDSSSGSSTHLGRDLDRRGDTLLSAQLSKTRLNALFDQQISQDAAAGRKSSVATGQQGKSGVNFSGDVAGTGIQGMMDKPGIMGLQEERLGQFTDPAGLGPGGKSSPSGPGWATDRSGPGAATEGRPDITDPLGERGGAPSSFFARETQIQSSGSSSSPGYDPRKAGEDGGGGWFPSGGEVEVVQISTDKSDSKGGSTAAQTTITTSRVTGFKMVDQVSPNVQNVTVYGPDGKPVASQSAPPEATPASSTPPESTPATTATPAPTPEPTEASDSSTGNQGYEVEGGYSGGFNPYGGPQATSPSEKKSWVSQPPSDGPVGGGGSYKPLPDMDDYQNPNGPDYGDNVPPSEQENSGSGRVVFNMGDPLTPDGFQNDGAEIRKDLDDRLRPKGGSVGPRTRD